MSTVRVDPHALPDPKDERIIRRIMRLTLCTLWPERAAFLAACQCPWRRAAEFLPDRPASFVSVSCHI